MKRRTNWLWVGLSILMTSCGGTATADPVPTLVVVTPLPTDTVVAPTATAIPEPTATIPAGPYVSTAAEEADAFLTSETEAGRFSGAVLVAYAGEVILNKGYGLADREAQIPVTSDTKFRIGSLTKAFTAMAIMQLQEQGKLSVHDPICDYLQNCPGSWAPVTIHHLLTHTSGIPGTLELPDSLTDVATPDPSERANIAFESRSRTLNFEPGSAWSYSNAGYNVLGLIIEQVSGASYEVFLQEHTFDPLALTGTGYDDSSEPFAVGYVSQFTPAPEIDLGEVFAAGALHSTVEDLQRWASALQTAGLVSEGTMQEIFAKQAFVNEDAGDYGYGWFIGSLNGVPIVEHGGLVEGYASELMMFPEDDLTIIVLSNLQSAPTFLLAEIISKRVLGLE